MDRDAIIAALIFGGSGSGGGLPAVTSADNGKVLGVANGAWATDTAELTVAITASSAGGAIIGTADKTAEEIYNAVQAGKSVEFRWLPGGALGYFVGWVARANKSSSYYTITVLLVSTAKYMAYVEITGSGYVAGTYLEIYSKPTGGIPKSDMATAIPYAVIFTITGQPVSGVYSLSANRTLTEINAAIDAGYDIIGACNIGGQDTPQARIASTAYTNGQLTFVGFTILGLVGGSPVMGMVEYDSIDGASLTMIPLSTAQMTYDSSTQTLSIVDPLA